MANFFGSLIGAAPYALSAIRTRQAEDDARQQRALQQIYQMNAENRASIASTLAYNQGAANILHTNAETDKLREPTVAKPKRTPSTFTANGQATIGSMDEDGNYYDAGGNRVTSASPYNKPPDAAKSPAEIPGTPEWKAAKIAEAQIGKQYGYHPETRDSFTPFQGTDPTTGAAVVRPFNTKTGQFGAPADVAPKQTGSGANLPAPMAAKVGQAGEMMKKAADILPIMEGLGVSLGQSASADVAQNGVGIGHARIPGTKGLGNMMMNNSPAYAQYQATLSPFVLAAAHAIGGARISQEQINQIRQSIELAPGDISNPKVVSQKTKNLLDLVNSITGALPPGAMAAQEGQMDPKTIADLEARGYRRAKVVGPSGNAPTGNIDLRQPAGPVKPNAKPSAKDYGIFGPPPSDENNDE